MQPHFQNKVITSITVFLCQTVCHCLYCFVPQFTVQATSLTAVCHAMLRCYTNVYRRFERSQSDPLLGQSVKEGCTLLGLKPFRQRCKPMARVPKMTRVTVPLARGIHFCQFLFISFARPASVYCEYLMHRKNVQLVQGQVTKLFPKPI
jgi:hypothetical protein